MDAGFSGGAAGMPFVVVSNLSSKTEFDSARNLY